LGRADEADSRAVNDSAGLGFGSNSVSIVEHIPEPTAQTEDDLGECHLRDGVGEGGIAGGDRQVAAVEMRAKHVLDGAGDVFPKSQVRASVDDGLVGERCVPRADCDVAVDE